MVDEKGGFGRRRRDFVDQVFSLRKIAKRENIYVTFTEMEKAYHRVERIAVWMILRQYKVHFCLDY